MKEINELLKKNEMRATSYKKLGNVILVDTNVGKVVIKKCANKNHIYNYLNTRNFDYYPETINDGEYIITKYIEDVSIPKEQKIIDLIDLVSLMHSKTTHYKEIREDEYKKIYEDLSNNFEYLDEYYNDLITLIDDKVFMSPSEYLLACNISFIFSSIKRGKELVEKWYESVKNLNKMRMTIVHNNLELSHYIRNSKDFLISWDKSKIDIPIFDLYNLYNNHFLDFDFYEILKRYESTYPLKKYEKELFLILINMPDKIEFNSTQFELCKKISNEIDKLYKSNTLIDEYKKSIVTN